MGFHLTTDNAEECALTFNTFHLFNTFVEDLNDCCSHSLHVFLSKRVMFPVTFNGKTVWLNVNVSQVPSEDWGGGYGGGGAADSGGEIPCRRMRSGSYIKAMGDNDSADSEASPKASPKSTLIAQRDAFRRAISMDQRSEVTNCASNRSPKLQTYLCNKLS